MTYMHRSLDKGLSWIVFAICLVALIFPACARAREDPCTALVKRLQEEGIYDRLIGWVDSTIVKGKLPAERLTLETGTRDHPKSYLVRVDFDWRLLGTGSKMSDIHIGCDDSGQWTMLMLGNGRFGVYVTLRDGVPLPSEMVVYKSRRVAVYCFQD
jgi:hypothetical protein